MDRDSSQQRHKNCSSLAFKSLMATQFLGAMNDNLFKVVITLAVVNALIGNEASTLHLVLINVLFVLPFILFSPLAGSIVDRRSKALVTRATKFLEVLVMGVAFYFFLHENVYALLALLFFMGFQSTLFSPAKYGILPEILAHEELSKGNGYLEFWTFAAIIFGTALSGLLLYVSSDSYAIPGAIILAVSLIGLITSFFVRSGPAARPQAELVANPLRVFETLREMKQDRPIFLTILAISFFWAVSAVYQLNVVLYAKRLGGLNDLETSFWLAALGVGIGLGSLGAGKVSEGKVEMGLVPLGAAGISATSIALTFSYSSYWITMLILFLLGFAAGLYIVPLNAFLQEKSPARNRGEYLAASNFVSFLGILISSFVLLLFIDGLSLTTAQVFFALGLMAIGAAVYICTVVPDYLLRCLNWITVHTIYRMKVVGIENVPQQGGALLVCNHVSFVDAPLLLSAIDRPIRFLMYKPIYEMKFVNPVARAMQTIPIESGAAKQEIQQALAEAKEAINRGEIVGIFPEGSITRLSRMLRFRRGLEQIMQGVDAPIIPVHLDQMWGSVFSRKGGKVFWKLPKDLPSPVTVSFGKPLPPSSKAYEVRRAVQELSAEAYPHRQAAFQVLHRGFVRSAKRYPFGMCMADSSGKKLNFLKALSAALLFAHFFKKTLRDEEMVGVNLPPSVAAGLTNIALLLAGKIPVNLNYTASKEATGSAIRRCALHTVISSNRFLEKLPFEPDFGQSEYPPPRILPLEDLSSEFGLLKRVLFFLCALLLPESMINLIFSGGDKRPDDLATIIFSSGSTGEPKGVMLSHANVSSNITSTYEIFEMNHSDCLLGVLPFFHSFGFMATLWLPLFGAVPVVYHNNPLQPKVIGKLAQDYRASVLIATPTFLLSYIKKVKPEQFKTLRNVFVGAEKLKPNIQQTFVEKFGAIPREGYGCTELSPIALGNIEDFSSPGLRQRGTKLGTAGHPLPGIAARIVDPERGSLLPPNSEGLLLIKGPNVMMGYLGDEEKTREVIKDGWYNTGDIASIDEDGFITITDRLSRFSKIGGEMVPHIKVEEEIHNVLGESEPVCVVSSSADERRGEKLIVLCTKALDGTDIRKRLSEKGIPNLWIPSPEDYFQIDSLPVLGSGKLDLKAIKEKAKHFAHMQQ